MKGVSIFALVLACGAPVSNVVAVDLVDINTMPEWFQQGFSKDKKVKKKSKLKIPEFGIETKIAGKILGEDIADGTWYYTIDIGSSTPVECYTFTDYDGVSTSFKAIMAASLEGAEALNQKPLSSQHTYALDTDMLATNTPYLGLETFYVVGEGKGAAAGMLKGLVAKTGDTLEMCIHNEIGYRKAFFTVFESYVAAFSQPLSDTPFFTAVYRSVINDIPVGYALERYTFDQDGDIHSKFDSAMLVPLGTADLLTSDGVTVEWSRTDGSVINTESHALRNGELAHHLSLQNNGGEWRVQGILNGESIDKPLLHSDWLVSNYGVYLAMMALPDTEERSSPYTAWYPDIDATKASTFVLRSERQTDTLQFSLVGEGIKTEGTAEPDGAHLNSLVTVEGVAISMDTIYKQGTPKQH